MEEEGALLEKKLCSPDDILEMYFGREHMWEIVIYHLVLNSLYLIEY